MPTNIKLKKMYDNTTAWTMHVSFTNPVRKPEQTL